MVVTAALLLPPPQGRGPRPLLDCWLGVVAPSTAAPPGASCANGTHSPPKDSNIGAPKLWWCTSSSGPATELTPSPVFHSTPSDKSPPIGVCSKGTRSLLSTSWAQASKPCP